MAEGGTGAILGAGMAGASAARSLAAAGLAVAVFDKGRGIGGRMATRRTESGLRFDHGAPSFRPRGAAFRARCEDWTARGIAALETRLDRPVRPTEGAVHRWRYARVETALGRPCLYDPARRLGAAGDWCLGPRVEAAFDSGRALGERIAADLTGAR